MTNIKNKIKEISKKMEEKGRLLVAFSGGVDSAVVAGIAFSILRDNAMAVTLDTESLPGSELKNAIAIAEEIGIRHRVVSFSETKDERYASNPLNRCYYCRENMAKVLKEIALNEDYKAIADGANISDMNEYRPGIDAFTEAGIWHPLMEANCTKEEIREMAKVLGLSIYNKPSMACLSSRISHDERITEESLRMVDESEEFLRKLNIKQVRVRKHGDIARIEILPEDMEKVLKHRDDVIKKIKGCGFKYVTLDIEGYISGSMSRGHR